MDGVDALFLELQGTLLGRYSLERELGRGGMGIVYLARDVALDRPVAIKLLAPALAAQAAWRERFLREARLAARLSHPNIVPIHAVEETARLVWFVMAYVPGETLGERLRTRGALPPADVSRILRDVAWALGHAHSQGIIHRDVKPENILLESGGRRTLIADFGIAAPAQELREPDGPVLGTIAYLSPEQAQGDRLDGRSDLYALGVVGYCALSSRLPYPVTSLAELKEHQLAGPPRPLAAVAPHVPRALARAIDRCLAPLPTARFRTGEALADALEHLGGGGGELPVPLRVWLAKIERQRLPTLAVTLLLGSQALGVAVALVFTRTGLPDTLAVVAMLLVFMSLPVGIGLAGHLLQTRKVLAAGYGWSDLVRALELQVERRREELLFEYGPKPTLAGRILRGLVRVTLGASLLAIVAGAVLARSEMAAALMGFGFAGLVAATVLHWLKNFIPGAHLRPRDRITELTWRLWRSRIGWWLTALAGWRLKGRAMPEELVHRPTEIALEDAAAALYRALPTADQKGLKALPDEIAHLARQAQAMRRRIEELDDLIAQAAPETLFGEDRSPAGDGGAGELAEVRSLWAARLRETVALLDSLRVGLLKLHAGSAAPEMLTQELREARDLKERLTLLLEGQVEVERLVRRTPA